MHPSNAGIAESSIRLASSSPAAPCFKFESIDLSTLFGVATRTVSGDSIGRQALCPASTPGLDHALPMPTFVSRSRDSS